MGAFKAHPPPKSQDISPLAASPNVGLGPLYPSKRKEIERTLNSRLADSGMADNPFRREAHGHRRPLAQGAIYIQCTVVELGQFDA